jgi:hypothetical protein
MPQHKFHRLLTTSHIFVILAVVLGGLVIVAVYLLSGAGRQLGDQRSDQVQQAQAPQNRGEQEVRRVLLKRMNQGVVEYIEILANGEMNIYDENMIKIRSRRLGIARVRSIFLDIEESLNGNRTLNGWDGYQIIVDTNKGQTIIDGGGSGGGGNGQWDEIIKEIEDTKETVFAPTATPRPTHTPVPPSTNNPTPTPTNIQIVLPTPTLIAGEPTPLPNYLTDPPFTCAEYDYLGRPIAISNVICGAD